MKLNKNVFSILYGILISTTHFILALFLLSKAELLIVVPVFAGEDDFAIRRMIAAFILIPGTIGIGIMLGKIVEKNKKALIHVIIYMLTSLILFGLAVLFVKDNISSIEGRGIANVGFFVYFIVFLLFNMCGVFFSKRHFR